MARNRIIYITAALCCLVFSMVYKEKISAVLLAAAVVYPVLALITVLVLLKLVNAEFSENTLTAEKGTRFELIINTLNKCVFPCVPMELICDLPDDEAGLAAEKRIFVTLPPFGKSSLVMNCMNRYRGRYSFKIKKISVFDPLRIIRLTKKGKSSIDAVFVPRKLSLSGAENLFGNENSFARKQNVNDSKDDFSHVRGYIPGESVQLVHWKLTAKLDELMIKQFDSINDRKALILCDFNSCMGEPDPLLFVDTVIETATAFAKEFLDARICAAADYGSGSNLISNQRDFFAFYRLMSVISPKTEPFGFASLIDKAAGKESVLVLITAELSEEIVFRANTLAAEETVFLAYVNLSGKAVERDRENERFILMNIKADGQEALTASLDS